MGPDEGHRRAGVQRGRRDRVRAAPAQAVARHVQRPQRGEGRPAPGTPRQARPGDARRDHPTGGEAGGRPGE